MAPDPGSPRLPGRGGLRHGRIHSRRGERLPEPESVLDNPELLSDEARSGRHVALSASVRAVADAETEEIAERALAAAFAAADSVDHLVSLNRQGSELRAINEAAGLQPVAVSSWTERIVLATVRWAERSEGAFEPTIGPLAELWGFGVQVDRAPTPEEIRQALSHVGYSKIEIDPDAHTIFLPEEGMRLDVRGAARGSPWIGCARRCWRPAQRPESWISRVRCCSSDPVRRTGCGRSS